MNKGWILVGIMALLAVACRPNTRPSQSMAAASEGIAGIVAHTESAQRHVAGAIPHADPTGKVYLAAATDEHGAILTNAAQARVAFSAAQDEITSLSGTLSDQKHLYQDLETRWYVRWGRRIERALWIIGSAWLLLGVASVFLGMGNPLSASWRIGKEITRLVPLMNPFSWIRDWLLSLRKEA